MVLYFCFSVCDEPQRLQVDCLVATQRYDSNINQQRHKRGHDKPHVVLKETLEQDHNCMKEIHHSWRHATTKPPNSAQVGQVGGTLLDLFKNVSLKARIIFR